MPITLQEFAKTLDEYDLFRFPRMGGPHQIVLPNFDFFYKWFNNINGRNMVFTSHNAIAEFVGNNILSNIVSKIFLDMDTDKGSTPDEVLNEVKKCVEFLKDNKISYAVTSSGGVGAYHIYIFLKPKIYAIDNELASLTRAVSLYLVHELNLKSVNMVCAEPKRLLRVPFSQYVTITETGLTNKNTYCTPLQYETIPSLTNNEVESLKKVCEYKSDYRHNLKYLTLKEFANNFKINPYEFNQIEPSEFADMHEISQSDVGDVLQLIFPQACIRNNLTTHNPRHITRVALAAQLRQLGWDFSKAVAFIDKVEEEYKWVDRSNVNERMYHIKHIWQKEPPYNVPKCMRLMSEGLCVGQACMFFNDFQKTFNKSNIQLNNNGE